MTTMAELGGPTDCPHKPGTPEHSRWMLEWAGREARRRDINGQGRADTAAMKAEANAAFEAAGYGRPDLVAELLGIDERPARASLHAALLALDITIDVDAVTRGIKQITDAVTAAFGSIDIGSLAEQLANLVRSERGIPPITGSVRLSIDPLARKRHGSAAFCPRHGATVGGMCRKCHR